MFMLMFKAIMKYKCLLFILYDIPKSYTKFVIKKIITNLLRKQISALKILKFKFFE